LICGAEDSAPLFSYQQSESRHFNSVGFASHVFQQVANGLSLTLADAKLDYRPVIVYNVIGDCGGCYHLGFGFAIIHLSLGSLSSAWA